MLNLRFDNHFRISILCDTNREIIPYTNVDSVSSTFTLRSDLLFFLRQRDKFVVQMVVGNSFPVKKKV